MSIESVMPYNHLAFCWPLLLPSIFPSIRVFSSESVLPIRWQSTGASALASVLPMNVQSLFPLEMTGLISLQSKGLSRVFSSTPVRKHQFFCAQPSLWSRSHIGTWLLEKSQLWLYRPLLPFLLFFPLLFHFTQNYFRDLIRHQCTEAKILASISTKFISSRTFLDHPQ